MARHVKILKAASAATPLPDFETPTLPLDLPYWQAQCTSLWTWLHTLPNYVLCILFIFLLYMLIRSVAHPSFSAAGPWRAYFRALKLTNNKSNGKSLYSIWTVSVCGVQD